jgi:hypothetical protein
VPDTATALLNELAERKIVVSRDGDTLLLTPAPGQLVCERDLQRLRALKPDLLAVLAEPDAAPSLEILDDSPASHLPPDELYRSLLWRWFKLTAGADPVVLAPVEGGGDLVQSIWEAERALGYAETQKVRRKAHLDWYQETGQCPTCGEVGVNHAG